MKFGKYADLTVQQVIDHYPRYIRWVYYNSSNITFLDDILNEVSIVEELRIDKPGINREMFENITKSKHFKLNYDETQIKRIARHKNYDKKKRLVISNINANRDCNLKLLRKVNHGHNVSK